MKSAAAVGMELMTAVFFFGHSSDTLIGQVRNTISRLDYTMLYRLRPVV